VPIGGQTMATECRTCFDQQFSLVYEELRRLAGVLLRSEQHGGVTPNTLVHEAWLKLAHSPEIAGTSPLHFRRIAARAMRQVLVEAARRRSAVRRGNEPSLVTFDESVPGINKESYERDILVLDSALDNLNRISSRQAMLVEWRFFGGLEVSELAALLDVSESTVLRDWRSARAWLAREIRRSLAGETGSAGSAGSDAC